MPPDKYNTGAGDMTYPVTDDPFAGIPADERPSLGTIIKHFAEECQRRFVARRSLPILSLNEGYQQSLSEPELDAWMSWYTTESAHEDVKQTVTRTQAKRNSATIVAPHLAARDQQSNQTSMSKSTISSPFGGEETRCTTSWYNDRDTDHNVDPRNHVDADHSINTIHSFEIDYNHTTDLNIDSDFNVDTNYIVVTEPRQHPDTSWFSGNKHESNAQCHIDSNPEDEKDEKDNEEHLTSWYADHTEPSSESTSQVYQQTIQFQSPKPERH